MALPLMPKATAVWLVENTTLTFDQVAEFCGLHKLEVQAIADRITVLRGGRLAAMIPAAGVAAEDLSRLMVGQWVTRPVRDPVAPAAGPGLVFEDLRVAEAGVPR